jgi:hypothetical protein
MKIAGYHRAKGDDVDWAFHFEHYDRIYKAKVFSFTPDDDTADDADEIIKGGTGYDIASRLPDEIEAWRNPDYSIYGFPFSIQFYSRGCIRHCPFCLVHDKEGYIRPVEPMELNPIGKWIEVLDNNFFANPEWREAIRHLKAQGQPVNFHGVDIRIMDSEQAEALNGLRLKRNIHIAWDLPQVDLADKLREIVKIIPSRKLTCYVLVGFNSTPQQDLYRLRTLKKLGITPFVQPYRDFENKTKPSQYAKDIARWANRQELFKTHDFLDFEARKNFKCSKYFESIESQQTQTTHHGN